MGLTILIYYLWYVGIMKSIQVYFEDADFEKLEKQKGKQSWREYILTMAKVK
jgi:hypothetical protein